MYFQGAATALAVIATLAFASAAVAESAASSKHGARRAHVGSAGARHAASGKRAPGRARLTTLGDSAHFAPLVGDPESGLGFYPLPWHIRVAAWRFQRQRAMRSADAIRAAVASTAIYSYGFPGYYGYSFGHHAGVFNPIDGYGTPFFGGYYSGGGGSD